MKEGKLKRYASERQTTILDNLGVSYYSDIIEEEARKLISEERKRRGKK